MEARPVRAELSEVEMGARERRVRLIACLETAMALKRMRSTMQVRITIGRIAQGTARQRTIAVARIEKNTSRNQTTMTGSTESPTAMSFEKRVRMRPTGWASKKTDFALRRVEVMTEWRRCV